MYRSLSGHRSRPRSPSPHAPRRGHHSLTIRTVNQQSPQPPSEQQHGTSSSPLQPPYPSYPLPIPPQKQAKARKLHQKYLMEVKLDQSKREPQSATSHHDPYLSVPGPRSVVSNTSSRRKRATSISTSTYDAVTELSSVVSFDGDESPSSVKAKVKGELMSFDGTPVKSPRIRRRLSSVKRAKAALVRHLGSCWVCHSRKVPCPLEHHDLDSLHQLTPQGNRTQSLKPFLTSPTTSSQNTDTFLAGGQQTPLSFSQSDALAGIEGGAGLEDLGPIAATLDIQSPGAYGETRLPAPATINYVAPALPTMTPNPYGSYQNGDMVALGILNGFYYCQHLDGLCNDYFNTDEELQQHFAIAHFEFTRINPAHRFVCSQCQHLNNDMRHPCYHCGAQGSIQLWIFGHYLRRPSYQRYAPDGEDFQGFTPYSVPFTSIAFPIVDWDLGPDTFGDNANSGGFDMQNTSSYGGPGNQAYSYNPPGDSDAGGSQYQGSNYEGAQRMASDMKTTLRLGYAKTGRLFSNNKVNIILFSLLVILTFGLSHGWSLCLAQVQFRQQSSKIHAHLPVIGFLVIISSFLLSLSVKYLKAKIRQRPQCKHRRPLHAFDSTSLPFKFRPPTLDTHLYYS